MVTALCTYDDVKDAAYLVGCPNLTVGHMPGYYDHTQYNIVVLLFTEADGRPSAKFVTQRLTRPHLNSTNRLQMSRLAWRATKEWIVTVAHNSRGVTSESPISRDVIYLMAGIGSMGHRNSHTGLQQRKLLLHARNV
ncbi:hypothetical protein EVAR_14771_1 [Eumeta japonica]|uniref:Uncharacterized protein n=1 Tax=Eumeta variegata TaxID=151549 RepID=A0A4C1TWS0_EUMVA|nr:hypothetical protein EVAR_14771_1 [Eumeta japonica]